MKSYDFIYNKLLRKTDFNYLNSKFYFNIESFCRELNDKYNLSKEQDGIGLIIKDLVLCFSEKYSIPLSDDQRQLLDELGNGGRIILFPYQPNIFPSISVLAPVVHMEIIRTVMSNKYQKKVIPLFMFVDYDSCTDKRFLKTYVPNPGKNNSKKIIGYTINDEHSKDAIFATPLPSLDTVVRWKKYFQESILNFSNIVKKYDESEFVRINNNVQKLLDIIDKSYHGATTFAAFNELFIHDILVNQWHLEVLFIEGRDIHNSSKSVLLKIEKNRKQINVLLNEAIDCFSRDGLITSFPVSTNNNRSLIWKYKSSCMARCSDASNCFSDCNPDFLLPTVIADYLMDYINIHKVGGVGYYKQFEATCVSEFILKEMYNIEGVPHFLTSVSIDFVNSYAKEHGIMIEKEFERLRYDYDKYLKSTMDPHCSILYHASILGIQETFDFIKKLV